MLQAWIKWATKRKILLSLQLGLLIIFPLTIILNDWSAMGVSGLGLVIICVLIMEDGGVKMKNPKQVDPADELYKAMGNIFGRPIEDRMNMYTEDK